jgi:glycolate dehydrogenase FAD-linked subunit
MAPAEIISKDIIDRLKAIVGPENVVSDEAGLLAYAYDATRLKGTPQAVVRPGTEEEVSKILSLASERGIPVIPRGAGSGLSGGAVAKNGGIILSFERMSRIISIDVGNRIATVQPGVVTADLQKAVEEKGLFYPPDPGSLAFCTIGGNVAENAGGMRAVKYGVTRDYVTALRAALPSGEVIRAGVKTAKGVVGYDLARLLVGSEGTLAVVTEITLKLIPLPERVITMTAFFAGTRLAGEAVAAIMASPYTPRCLEFLDGEALSAGAKKIGYQLPENAGAFLLVETDGNREDATRQMDGIRALMKDKALEIKITQDKAVAAELWKLRRSTSQALFSIAPHKINEDTVVPIAKVPEALEGFREIAARLGQKIICFGHAGDGNIHVNVMTDKSDPERLRRAEEAIEEVFRLVLALGGTISGEHGVGLTKLPYIGMELNDVELNLLKKIKSVFDPEGILNPGKIFP